MWFLTVLISLALLQLPGRQTCGGPGCALPFGGAAAGGTNCCKYYVDPSGSDGADGLSAATAWQTVSKVNGTTLVPGDSVGFKSGGTWRETLVPGQSGSAGTPITYTSYGAGSPPRIDAADLRTWTQGTGLPAQESCTGSCLFGSGFETGGATFTDWTSRSNTDTTISQSTANPAHGTFSAAILGVATGNRAFVQKTLSAFVINTTYYFRFYINIPAGAMTASQSIKASNVGLGSGGSNMILTLFTNASGNVFQVSWFDTTHSFGLSNVPVANFTMGAWNYIEYSFTVSATVGGVQAWVNGSSIGSVTNKDTSSAVGWNNVLLGNNNFASCITAGQSVYFDDFQESTAPIGAFSGGGAYPATVWRTSQATDPLYPNFSGTPGVPATSLAAVTGPNQYFWDGSAFLYAYGPGDPANVVEVPARTNAVTVTGKSYITVIGLDIRGARADGFSATGQVSNMTILGSTFELNWENGWLLLENSATVTNGLISANVFMYNGGNGSQLNASHFTNWKFLGNQVHHNCQIAITSDGDHQFCGGTHFYSLLSTGNGSVVSGETVYSNGVAASTGGQGNGIWPDSCSSVTVTNNTVYNNTGTGIYLEKNLGSAATYNVAYNNASIPFTANIAVKSSGEVPSQNAATMNAVYHNTSYGGYYGIFIGAYEGIGTATVTQNLVKNNLSTGAANNLWIDIGGNNDGTYGSANVYTFNGFGPQASNFTYWCTTSGSSCSGGFQSTYAGLDTAYGSSMNNMQLDPKFVNPGTGDFSLQPGSPAIGAGIFIPGVSTANPPNMGAK